MTSASPEQSRKAGIITILKELFEEASGIDFNQIDDSSTFLEMGMDSLFLTQVSMALSKKFKLKITFRQLLEDYTDLDQLSQFIDSALPADALPAARAATTSADPAPPATRPAGQMPACTTDNSMYIQPLAAFASMASPAMTGELEQLISQQLQIMARQIELLAGGSVSIDMPASEAAPPAAPPAAATEAPVSEAAAAVPAEGEKKTFVGPGLKIVKTQTPGITDRQKRHIDELIKRYNARTKSSKEFTQAHRTHLADPRAASGFKPLLKELVYPIVVNRSLGSRLWDIDGNEYIDMLNGFGSNFFGHRAPFVIEALERQLKTGIEIGPQHPLAGQLAGELSEFLGHDRVAFCNTGSEAVLGAMRIARTITGRDLIAMFTGAYHGIFDEVIVRGTRNQRSVPAAPGIQPGAVANILVLDYATEETLNILKQRAGELAAILVEPVQSRLPELQPKEFLHELRELTKQSGTALIFDEVVTGFRAGPRGAQGHFGIKADLATYGKVLGGGMNIGVIAGDRCFMDALDGGAWQFGDDSVPEVGVTYFAGTFVRHPPALAAAKAVLDHLKAEGPDLQLRVNEKTARLVREVNEYAERIRVPVKLTHFTSVVRVAFTQDVPLGELLFVHMREKGVHIWDHRPVYMTAAHSDEDVSFVINAFKQSFDELLNGDILPLTGRGVSIDMPGQKLQSPPLSGARLGRDASGYPAWFVPDPARSGKYCLVGAANKTTEIEYDPFAYGELLLTVPSTESQREIWASAQMGAEASLAYNESVSLGFQGDLNLTALRCSVQYLIQRHESLRATFSPDGTTLCIATPADIDIEEHDFSGITADLAEQKLGKLLEEAVLIPFDLEHGPLFRAQIVRINPRDHVLVLTAHHIVCDGWSYAVLLRELGALYGALSNGGSPELKKPDSFSAYSRHLAERERTTEYEEDESFWLNKFSTPASPLDIPLDGQRPSRKTYTSLREDYTLDADLVQSLKKSGAKYGCSFFVTILAAFNVLMNRLSGQDEIIVGIPSAGQSATGMLNLVGHCVNTLPLRNQINNEAKFTDLLKSVKTTLLDAQDHQQYTYGSLLRKLNLSRDPSRMPLVSVLFNIDQSLDPDKLGFGEVRTTFATNPRRYENFEMFINAVEDRGNLILEVQYNSDIFSPETIRDRFACFETILRGITDNPETVLSRLPILPAEQIKKILAEWNNTSAPFPASSILTDLLRDQALQNPESIAAVFGNASLTYRELDLRSNSLANVLRTKGVNRGTLVGVFVDRSLGMLVCLLATLKAGGAYVPLDPGFPKDRISYMLENSAAPVIISQQQLLQYLPENNCSIVLIDETGETSEGRADTPPDPIAGPEDPAYVIYTSGSTGKPKGVVVPHRAVTNFLTSMAKEPGISKHDVLVAVTTISFDIAVLELYLPLIAGAKVVIADRDITMDGNELLKLMKHSGATIMQATPATWRMLITSGWDNKDLLGKKFKVLVGGEALPRDLADQLVERAGEVWNMYGPTETTVWSTCHPIKEKQSSIVIGKPIANTQLYILDNDLKPVPAGVPGELLIGGSGVTLGYLHLPDMTAERFIDNPFVDHSAMYPSPKLYRTGDLARYMPDGTVDFIGRNDNQVKVRGYRIELGEIEYALMNSGLLQECVVIVREDTPGDQRITAYVVSAPSFAASGSDSGLQEQLRSAALKSLPSYMVPQQWIALQVLPKTQNGKIDRKALPAPAGMVSAETTRTRKSPQTASEKKIFELWKEILKRDDFGIDEDFFHLGGHSLLIARLIARIQRAGLATPTFRDVFTMPTVEKLSQWIDEHSGTPAEQPPQVPRRADRERAPLSLMQQRIWYVEQISPGTAIYNLPAAFRFHGKLDIQRLRECLQEIIDRHSALRTYFDIEDGLPIQRIKPELQFSAPFKKCTLEEIRELIHKESEIPFDTGTAPMIRAKLIELVPDNHTVLFMVVHHAVWDGWSFDLLLRDLKELYEAKSAGREPRLPVLTIDYADFSVWHRTRLESGNALESQKKYWLNKLRGPLPVLELPRDYKRPDVMTYRGDREEFRWDKDYLDKLNRFALQQGCTLQMLLLAAYKIFLERLTGLNDLIVGAPIQGRNLPEVEDVIGFFVNALVLRTRVDEDISFADVIARVRETCVDAYANQDIPFEVLVEELRPPRNLSHTPIFQSFFTYQDVTNRQYSMAGFPISHITYNMPVIAADINFWFRVGKEGFAGAIDYSTNLFKPERIKGWLRLYRQILDTGILQPDIKVRELPKDPSWKSPDSEPGKAAASPVISSETPAPGFYTAEEQYLISLWGKILHIENITPRDNFFNLGGHSLLSIQVIAQIERETGHRLSPRIILLNTLGQIAAQLRSMGATETSPSEQTATVSANIAIEPFYFDSGGDRLFGILHRPVKANEEKTGVLFCAPIAQEYMRTHWILRQTAAALNEAGYYVLRFDYTGCGDSSGPNLKSSVRKWALDANAAEKELRARAGLSKTVVFAVRFGAVIAAMSKIDAPLVLWDPVESGSSYLKDLELLEEARRLKSPSPKSIAESNELIGFGFSPALRTEINTLSLPLSPENLTHRPEIIQSEYMAPWNDVKYWGSAILSGEVVKAIVSAIHKAEHTERGPQ